jgi:uncharacterized protein
MSFEWLAPEIAGAVTNDRLELIVNPTERCNLRCVYCYETFSIGKIPRKLIQGIVRLVQRRAESGLKNLRLEFFGGEPLTAWVEVERIAQAVSEICTAHGVDLTGGMTTNATLLTTQRLERLCELGLLAFQVTLDGPEHIHDKRRVGPRGEGSYTATIAALNLLKASPHNLGVLLRLHFDPTSLDVMLGPAGFVAEVVQKITCNDPRFRLHFHALGRWGGQNDASTAVFDSAAESRGAIDRLVHQALAAGFPPERILDYRQDAALGESGHAICYAARANAFVIRSDGSVSKCTVALNDERNIIGRLTPDGELIIDHQRHLPWMRGLVSGDGRELSCPAIGFVQPQGAA